MKILHVIDTLNVGGAEKVFILLTSLLRKNNVHCDALLFHNTGQLIKELDPAIKLYHLNRDNKYSIKKIKQAHHICRQYDIIHVHLRHCYAYIRLVQIIFRGRYKLILHDHTSIIPSAPPFRLSGLFRPQYYIGVSNAITSWAKNDLDICNCYILQNTIALPKSIYNNPNNSSAILISNITEVKQIPLAIAICEKANISLTVYGNRQDQEYFNNITKTANAAGVKIKEGVKDFTDVYDRYSIALHTSRSETGPLVLLEYMANGIPFLAYKTGAVAETVAGELPLHFMNSFNIDEWVARIKLIRSQGDISDMLKAVFRKYYSTENYVQQCLKIYQDVLC